MKESDIKNPWCIYKDLFGPFGYGKVVRDSGESIWVLYSENQLYPETLWDSKVIERFKTLEEAVEEYIRRKPRQDLRDHIVSDDRIRELAKEEFPSYFEKE